MHPIIYDVAVSLDGYICGPSGDVSMFAYDGPAVDDYIARLGQYTTAIMGRATYEAGYGFGLKPGQNPYGHMETLVFSKTLDCPADSEISVKRTTGRQDLLELKKTSKGLIYLCGGGAFAGWLQRNRLIDQLRLKRAPIILGSGVPLFGDVTDAVGLKRVNTKTYDNGYIFEEFTI